MRVPTPQEKQRVVDMLENNNCQRFEARRQQAQRALGALRGGNGTQGSGARSSPGPVLPVRASVDRLTPAPALLIAVMSSLLVVFVLAVAGAYSLIHEVFSR